MCNRIRDPNQLEISEIKLNPLQRPRGDWRPGNMVQVVISTSGQRLLEAIRWGLIPSFSTSEHLDYSTYNARAERIAEAPTYRGAWRKEQRCLFPMEGFYERDKFFRLKDGGLMMAAGLYDDWRSPIGPTIRSGTMITTRPNELVSAVHDRMPVIVAREDWAKWLGEVPASEAEIRTLMRPYPAALMATGVERPRMSPGAISVVSAEVQGSLF